MFRWASFDDFAILFLVLGILILGYGWRCAMSKRHLLRRFSYRVLKYYWPQVSLRSFAFGKKIFFIFGSFFAILSLMQPQWGQSKIPQASEGVEMVFAIDISLSMAAEDVKPDRLGLVKLQLKKLFTKLQGHRMGLVAFAGQVGVISPLTQDTGALSLFLDSLDFETITEQGTNIRDALAEARALLQHGSDVAQKNNQLVILVTDGEDHSEDSIKEVEKLYAEGIRTYVMSVGSDAGAPIPMKDSLGESQGYLKDSNGKVVFTKTNIQFLKSLAEAGHGSYYSLSFGNRLLDTIQADLNKLKTVSFEAKTFDVRAEYFQYPLSVAIVCFMLSFLMPSTGPAVPLRALKYLDNKEES